MGKAGLAVPTGPFTATGHRLRVLSLGQAGQRDPGGGWAWGCAGVGVSSFPSSQRHRPPTHTQKPQMCTLSHTQTYERHTGTPQSHSYSAVTEANMHTPSHTHRHTYKSHRYVHRHTHRHTVDTQTHRHINTLTDTLSYKHNYTQTPPKVIHTQQSQL